MMASYGTRVNRRDSGYDHPVMTRHDVLARTMLLPAALSFLIALPALGAPNRLRTRDGLPGREQPRLDGGATLLDTAPYRLRIGDTMPDIELPRLDGSTLRLGTLRGKTVVVSFYSPYCEPCRHELPALQRAIQRVHHDTGAAITMVVVVTEERPSDDVVKQHPSALWLLDPDGRAQSAFDPRRLPCTFAIDTGTTVRHINRGFGPGYEARVGRWLREMVSGRGS